MVYLNVPLSTLSFAIFYGFSQKMPPLLSRPYNSKYYLISFIIGTFLITVQGHQGRDLPPQKP